MVPKIKTKKHILFLRKTHCKYVCKKKKKIKYQNIALERVSYQQQNKRCHIRSIGTNTCFGIDILKVANIVSYQSKYRIPEVLIVTPFQLSKKF
jgi:hypothetical protein